MLKYVNEHHFDDGSILSCDGLRIKFSVRSDCVEEFSTYMCATTRIDIVAYPPKTKDFAYKYMWTINYGTSESMTVGFEFNGSNHASDVCSGFLDFNPNKVADFGGFWSDFRYIKSLCEEWTVLRCDIAYDIRAKRENVILVKDNRKYELIAYSLSNRTECLGMRSAVGRVKVYNKTLEAKLDYDLTRIEVTCEPTPESFFKYYPEIYNLELAGQFGMDVFDLSTTELALVRLILECQRSGIDNGMMIFNSLDFKKKQKLKTFVCPESALVLCSSVVVSQIFGNLRKDYVD